MVAVALYVVVARAYPEELRGKVFAGLSAAWVVPALVGPALAGVVVEVLGWRWVFLGVPVVVILPVLALRRTLTRLPSQEVVAPWPRARLLNAVGAAGGAVLLHVASQQEGLGRVALIGAGLAVLAVCTPRLLPAGTWRVRRGLPTVIALRGLVGAGFTAAEVFVPLLLSRERGLSPSLAGLVLTAAAITWASGSWLRSRAGLQHRNALVLRLGAAAIAIGIMLAAAVVSEAVPVFVAMIGWAVGGLGMGMIYPTLSVLTLQLSPVSEQGLNTSALQLNDSLSAVVALALSGVLYAGLIDATPVVAYVACFGAALVLVLLAFVVAPRVNPRAEGAG